MTAPQPLDDVEQQPVYGTLPPIPERLREMTGFDLNDADREAWSDYIDEHGD